MFVTAGGRRNKQRHSARSIGVVEAFMPHAVVILYDIRGFTTAAKRIPEARFGAFITEAHQLVLSFLQEPPPTFTKNLGDGNLLLWEVEERPPAGMIAALVRASVLAQREYHALVARQAFDGAEHLPRELGFGVVFGTVTRGDDWYGNAINLAARLQDCARPRGVILDEGTFRLIASEVSAIDEPITVVRAPSSSP
jgi:class 3 adenylate cyclase